jgi:CheY-like chemotaxis protein
MNSDQWVKLIQIVFLFFQALIVPVTIYLVFRYFGPSIKKFIENSSKVSGKISPTGIEFSTEQLETTTGQVSASLTAASISKEAISLDVISSRASDNTQRSPKILSSNRVLEIGYVVGQALNPQVTKQLTKTSILWIEDIHEDNSFEKNAIETLGIQLVTCRSIEEALGKVQLNQYEVIISSINLASKKQKLYILLEKVHDLYIRSYIIIYASLNNPEDNIEAIGKGVFGSTNDPLELFQLIVKAVQIEARSLRGTQTLGEFFKQFVGLQTNLYKILIFGYWCEIKQGQSHFTSEDILAKYREARETPPANIGRDLRSLVSKGLLLPPGQSEDGTPTYALSNSGIKEVESRMSQA